MAPARRLLTDDDLGTFDGQRRTTTPHGHHGDIAPNDVTERRSAVTAGRVDIIVTESSGGHL